MTNTISDYFTDEDLVTQLTLQFDEEEMHTFNFKRIFHEIEDIGDCFQLRIRKRIFNIDKISGTVTEVKK